ncbi:hypothetical protein B0H11DRAFT_2364947 [Mycena galericulata]|nr:hypothetical protein B0H11DRAFT_2364947 [Mycena galericulata]
MPIKRWRPRPVSDDMLLAKSKSFPRRIIDGILTLLGAATNDLTQLVTCLDLDGAPCPPWHWPAFHDASPPGAAPSPAPPLVSTDAAFKRMHRRLMTPTPEPHPTPVFQPLCLCPSRIRPTLAIATSAAASPPPSSDERGLSLALVLRFRGGAEALLARRLPQVVARGHVHNHLSLLPDTPSPQSSRGSAQGMSLAREAMRILGMGGSDALRYDAREINASDPDSDIPNELQVILSASRGESPVDDTFSFRPPVVQNAPLPSPGLPPLAPLPVSPSPPQLELPIFNAQLVEDDGHLGDIDEGGLSSEEDTKKSFNFTGELQKLNESDALRGLLNVDVPPPLPLVPVTLKQDTSGSSTSSSEQTSLGFHVPQSVSRIVDMKEPTMAISSDGDHTIDVELYTESRLVDLREPTLLPGSDGQLNVKFKFGGELPPEEKKKSKKPLTLSDIIPPPAHVRSQSLSSLLEEEDSVLKSIFANAADIPRPRVNSDSSARRFALQNSRQSMMSMQQSRPASTISFTGLESFDEARRGFEFHNNRPAFYPPSAATNRPVTHAQQDSLFSIASVSSYGHVTNPGINDPFEDGLPMPSLRERPSSEDLSISMSINVEDTFSFLGREPRRQRVESDASSFYFKATAQPSARGHRHRESNVSVSSQGPPNSFYNYNRSFGNHRSSENDTSTSGSSLAHQYAAYGANGGRAAWAKHRQDSSMDSVLSDFSVARLGRPREGDKMSDTAVDRGIPLRATSASPPESRRARRSSMEDSLFEKTGHRSSMSSDSVFGYDGHNMPNVHLLPPNQFRPLSMLSVHNSVHSPMKEDDTMISMLGGGHVRRRSIGSLFEASPCVRVKKRKHPMFQEDDQPNKARILTKASIASTTSSKFGGERMIKATQGLLVRQSLEESCLIAAGEDLSALRPTPVFSRPSPNSRSRSSTITTSSSGADTPPLSSAEGSSMSEGSQSSIDMSQVNVMLSNATHPMSSTARDRVRARARGHGHRRRVSVAQARASRSSVYETIQEELASPVPSVSTSSKKSSSPTACQGVFVVDHDAGSVDLSPGGVGWDDERGIVALRKYYALRHEAEDTVLESKRMWSDTPFSVYALQAAPESRGDASPPEPQPPRPSSELLHVSAHNTPLQAVAVNANVDVPMPAAMSPKRENAWGLAPNARPRVASAARRTALGWAKRNTKASTDQKENNTSMTRVSFMMTPGESLRISRPRPRGRPTPARPGAATPRHAIAAV